MKCYNIYSTHSYSPTYRNIEESLAQAIENNSTVLVDNEKLYHEMVGDLFINNITLDVQLVENKKSYKFEIDEYGEVNINVMIITSNLTAYALKNSKCMEHKKVFLVISRKEPE